MGKVVKLNNRPEYYSIKDCASVTCTCEEFLSHLSQYEETSKIVICNDNGYTFSAINLGDDYFCKIMKDILIIRNQREYYSAKNCAEASMTISDFAEFIHNNSIENYKVLISNDNGYMYSALRV